MAKTYMFNNKNYELEKNYKDGFDKETVESLITDYYDNYDYIVGDWAYNKLRLKGFCDRQNKINNKINNIENLDRYIKENCAYECRYFVLKKISNAENK